MGAGYSYWNAYLGDHRLFGVFGVDIEPRFWILQNHQGLYAGLYGAFGEFDIQDKISDPYVTGKTGRAIVVGGSVGYMLGLGSGFYFDFEARIGYCRSNYKLYTIEEAHNFEDGSKVSNRFSPQVRIQFVYKIDFNKGR